MDVRVVSRHPRGSFGVILTARRTLEARTLGGAGPEQGGYRPSSIRETTTANCSIHPEPLTLAYSEHLTAQALQIAPVHALTGNPILCYNLVFLSTFVLSALGAFLLARELTGCTRAALVAGLVYGFGSYRLAQLAHVQLLSSQWMPLALLGLRRHLQTARAAPLIGAAAALILQNLSCGYLMVYFAHFVAAYGLHEMATRGLLRDARTWGRLLAAAAGVALVTVPFLLPYVELRLDGILDRDLSEIEAFSAGVYSYAPEWLRRWRGLERPEAGPAAGIGPSWLPLLLAGAAIAGQGRASWRAARRAPAGSEAAASGVGWGGARRLSRIAVWGSLVAIAIELLGIAIVLAGFAPYVPGMRFRASGRTLWTVVGLVVVVLAASPRARLFLRGLAASSVGFFGAAAVLAAWLSLGPTIHAAGVPVDAFAPYRTLYDHVPGVDALRAPARMGMVVWLFYSTYHWRPLLNGFSGVVPGSYDELRRALTPLLRDPERAWQALMRSSATHVIVHQAAWRGRRGPRVTDSLVQRGARVVATSGTDVVLELPRQ